VARRVRKGGLTECTCLTSKKTIGLSLRMADLSSAFAFAGVLQATSCTPGMAWKYDSRRCECSAPSWRPTPAQSYQRLLRGVGSKAYRRGPGPPWAP
jgi:hypothetical protein